MGPNGTPAGEDELILALAAGASVREAAERGGVGERTVYRRLADADFRRAVSEARGGLFDSARGRLAGLASRAVETLQRLMKSEKPAEALGAAKTVLELGPRLSEATEAEERISRLEDEADEQIGGNQTPAEEELLALAAGAEQRTARHRLADADFRRAVSRARGRLLDSALGRLAGLAGEATGILERLMESDQPSVARRAAKAVLELGPRLREATELEERMSRLEGRAGEQTNGTPTPVIADNG
ncbi:MAG TPA: hypothetical protein VG826_14390 [Pirellulales bacterium]|nr:hypothetical protein [Pirellulales bacterium]